MNRHVTSCWLLIATSPRAAPRNDSWGWLAEVSLAMGGAIYPENEFRMTAGVSLGLGDSGVKRHTLLRYGKEFFEDTI